MVRCGYSGYKNLEASSYAIEKDKKFKIIYEKIAFTVRIQVVT